MTTLLQIERNLTRHHQILMLRCVLFNIRRIIQLLLLFLEGLLLSLHLAKLILEPLVLNFELRELGTFFMKEVHRCPGAYDNERHIAQSHKGVPLPYCCSTTVRSLTRCWHFITLP